MNKTILITGIHGFVGRNLVTTLKKQHTIYGLDIVSPQKDGVIQTFGWNELKDIPLIDCVIHLAGKAHDTIGTQVTQMGHPPASGRDEHGREL